MPLISAGFLRNVYFVPRGFWRHYLSFKQSREPNRDRKRHFIWTTFLRVLSTGRSGKSLGRHPYLSLSCAQPILTYRFVPLFAAVTLENVSVSRTTYNCSDTFSVISVRVNHAIVVLRCAGTDDSMNFIFVGVITHLSAE